MPARLDAAPQQGQMSLLTGAALLTAAFCTAGRAYAGSTASLLSSSKASTATGILFAAGLAASKQSQCCYTWPV